MVSIVNYGMGNIKSIQGALNYLGRESKVINSAEDILSSQKLILPGVGSYAKAMENIKTLNIFNALNKAVLNFQTPILGICLGMQLLTESSEEDGHSKGFGWIAGEIRKFKLQTNLKIPHIGFNTVHFTRSNNKLFQGLGEYADFYFVHNYRLNYENQVFVSSWAEYGEKFATSVNFHNIFGTQFHPEKSQNNGLIVLKNFLEI